MPKYVYYCHSCDQSYEIRHSLSKVHKICEICNVEGELERKPAGFFLNKKVVELHTNSKPGKVVKATIEEAKEELKLEQARLKSREYTNND
jgi:L-lysine 2,3-aminomutase|tara:strand:- start:372 stop:644 length:273 start_codon:yes stop_codon:yes gene_type:complete